MKLVEWNIHKMKQDILVKQFVIDTLIHVDADIICLVEYLTDKGIEESLKDEYWFEESNSISGNKVFIAIKKKLAPSGIIVKNKDEVRDCYNFLHVEFLLQNGEPFSVIGIRMLSPMDASKQTPLLNRYISKLKTSFICTGDFNILDFRMSNWFPDILTERVMNTHCALCDSSIIYVNKYDYEVVGFGAVDHVLHSDNLNVESKYDWKFVSLDSIYPSINQIAIGTIWKIPPSYPDHALMISNIEISR